MTLRAFYRVLKGAINIRVDLEVYGLIEAARHPDETMNTALRHLLYDRGCDLPPRDEPREGRRKPKPRRQAGRGAGRDRGHAPALRGVTPCGR